MDNIIKTLISLTKKGKLEWEYLDFNSSLCESINYSPKQEKLTSLNLDLQLGKKRFDVANSFYTKVNDNYLILIVDYSENKELIIDNLYLLLSPRTFKGIERIDSNEDLLYLQSIIKNQFPSVNDIKKDLLDMDNE